MQKLSTMEGSVRKEDRKCHIQTVEHAEVGIDDEQHGAVVSVTRKKGCDEDVGQCAQEKEILVSLQVQHSSLIREDKTILKSVNETR